MILRKANLIPDAKTEDLITTIEEMTGDRVDASMPRAALEVRCNMALLYAANEAGHLGVPSGAHSQPLTVKERNEMATKKGIRKELTEKIETREVNKPKRKPAAAKKGEGAKRQFGLIAVTPKEEGTSAFQENSERAKVMQLIRDMFKRSQKPVTLEKLSEKFGKDARPFVHKLIMLEWLEPVYKAEEAVAP